MAALIDGLHVVRPRPDRALAEGRPGRLGPAHLARAAASAPAKAPAGASTSTSASTCSAPRSDKNLVTAAPSARWRSCRPAPSPPAAWWSTPASASPSSRPAGPHRRRDPRRAQPLPRRAGAVRAALRRPHAGQHARPRRGLPARRAAASRLRRSSRRSGSTAPRSRRTWRRSPGAARWSPRPDAVEAATRRARAADARELVRGRARADRRSRSPATRRAAPAARAARARAGGLPGRGLRAALRRVVRRVHVAEQERTPGTPSSPRPSPATVQADGLQGRVRGRAPAPRRRRAGQAAARVRRRRQGRVQPPPAAAARARPQAQAAARPLVRARVPALCRMRRLRGTGSTRSATPRSAGSSAS